MTTRSLVLVAALFSVATPLAAWQAGPRTIGGGPGVSPDGTRILFVSNRTGRMQVYLMMADGSDVRQLTNDSTRQAYDPAWCSDGQRIVLIMADSTSNIIATMRADGSAFSGISNARGDQTPSWSPDCSRILFATGVFPNINIWSMRSDGSDRQNLSPNPGFDYDPEFSPDGRRIAFVTAIRGQGPRIWVMNADGTGRRRLSGDEGGQERPAWSPDGRSVAFQSAVRDSITRRATDVFIRVTEVDGGSERRLGIHDAPLFDETPSWFPDGRRLAIQTRRSGDWKIYVLDLDDRVTGPLTP